MRPFSTLSSAASVKRHCSSTAFGSLMPRELPIETIATFILSIYNVPTENTTHSYGTPESSSDTRGLVVLDGDDCRGTDRRGGRLDRRRPKDQLMLDALIPLALLSPYLLMLAALAVQPAAVIPLDDD